MQHPLPRGDREPAPRLVERGAPAPRRLLIVNADDFGLTPGVSSGILRAHRDGIVTSTSVLAVGTSLAAHESELRDSGIGVGVHFALVGEDVPLLTPSEIPTLLTRGRFPRSWREFSVALVRGLIDVADIRRELEAQLERVSSAVPRVSHVDSHQHVHLLPSVASVVIELATEAGISAIRVPRARPASPRGIGVNLLARRLDRAAGTVGMRRPEAFIGLESSGHMTDAALPMTLERLAHTEHRSVELGVHPGAAHDPERVRFAWGFEWGAELDALCAPRNTALIADAGYRLGTFDDLC